MAQSVTGLRLLSAASSEPQAIAGLPGLWSTEAELSVVPADLGLDDDDLAKQAKALGFSVEKVEWERESAAKIAVDEGNEMTVAEIEERIESFSDEELGALSQDERKGAREAAIREVGRRSDEEAEG